MVKYCDDCFHNTLYLYYDEAHNVFFDEDGKIINNIFTLITPNDLYLFKFDALFHHVFPHREDPKTICILESEEE